MKDAPAQQHAPDARLETAGGDAAPSWVIADSMAALDWAFANGVDRTVRIETASPGVLAAEGADAVAIDGHLAAADMAAIHDATLAMALDIHAALRDSSMPDVALSLARVPVRYQAVIYRASTLRAHHFEAPGVVAEIDAGNAALNARFGSPLAGLLSGLPGVEILTAPAGMMPHRVQAAPPVAGFWSRFRHASMESIAYRVVSGFWRRMPVRGSRGTLWILRENELLKEAALWLALRGYALKNARTPKPEAEPLSDKDWAPLSVALADVFNRHIPGHLQPGAAGPLRDWYLATSRETLEMFRGYRRGWRTRIADNRPVAILSNSLSTPAAEALYAACHEAGVPYFAFQHGMTREICRNVASLKIFMENCAADYSVLFNRESAAQEEDNPYKVGKPLIAGMPRDYFRTGREGMTNETPPVWYVSACLLLGNTSLLNLGAPDHAKVSRETELLNVLNGLPHRVLYKPYPGGRYIDPDPVSARAEQEMANITVYRERIDLRYIAAAARVIVTARGSGTFSWCFVPGKPVVFVNFPDQAPLREEIRAQFEAAVFTFDATDIDWKEKLADFLSQPLEVIEVEWERRAPARTAFLKACFDEQEGHGGGRRAAQLIHGAIQTHPDSGSRHPQERSA